MSKLDMPALEKEAKSKRTKTERLRELTSHKQLHSIIARNPNAPHDVLKSFLNDHSLVGNLIRNPKLPADLQTYLLENSDYPNLAKLARWQDLNLEQFMDLLYEGVLVRTHLAESKYVPEGILSALAFDFYEEVRRKVRKNRRTPEESQHELSIRQFLDFTQDVNVLQAHLTSSDVCFRHAIACSRSVTEDMLKHLQDDESVHVRCAVAQNVHSSSETMCVLSEDEDWRVRLALGERYITASQSPLGVHDRAPVAILKLLMKDQSTKVQKSAKMKLLGNDFYRETTPKDVLLELSKDQDSFIVKTAQRKLSKLIES